MEVADVIQILVVVGGGLFIAGRMSAALDGLSKALGELGDEFKAERTIREKHATKLDNHDRRISALEARP